MDIPYIERAKPDEVKKIQTKLLRDVVNRVYNNSKFYREMFHENNLSPFDIKTIEDLRKIPFTTKDDLKKRNWDFLCVSNEKIVDIVASSGTTGNPTYITLTKNDTERLASNEEKSFLCAGATSSDIFQLLITLDGMFTAGMAFYRGITRLGACALRVGPGNSEMHLRLMKELKPNGVVGVPSFMLRLEEVANQEGIDISSFNLEKGMFVAEALRNQDMSLNKLGKKIEDSWGIELFSTYGSTEIETSFCECTKHTGLHMHPDLVIIEVLDKNGEPVEDGEYGELVVTTLQTEGMPFLRFESGDVTFLMTDECECGRTATRIGPILGRMDHMMKVKGTNVYPGHIENVLMSFPEVDDYVIETYTGNDFSDKIIVKIATKKPSKSLEESIKESFKALIRTTPDVSLTSLDEIKKIQFAHGERKPRKFIDKRKKKKFYRDEDK
jgi:phenylacetate-CoA ligase